MQYIHTYTFCSNFKRICTLNVYLRINVKKKKEKNKKTAERKDSNLATNCFHSWHPN